MSTYKVFCHQHLHEIRQTLCELQGSLEASVDFIPYRGDFPRGIFCTEVVTFNGKEGTSSNPDGDQLASMYKDYYKDAVFTHYVDKPIDLKQVVNTNKALVHVDKFGNKAVITSIIDNLLKGAVGQAVQNMNIMFGIDEATGLKLKASAF
jgi:N-acetyl-gamma-glutamyl-phosphate reductase